MKQILIHLDDKEHLMLTKRKGDMTWKEYLLKEK